MPARITVAALLVLLVLTACTSPTEAPPTSTSQPTLTQEPTQLPTETPDPTPTPVPSTPTTPPLTEIADPVEDYLPAYIDVVSLNYYITGETLVAELVLRELPETLPFNRPHVQVNRMEYKWDVFVDLDNDLQTGSDVFGQEGADANLAAAYFIFEEAEVVEEQLANMVQVNLMEAREDGPGWSFVDHAELRVVQEENKIILTSQVPGITSDARVFFQTAENHPDLGFITDQLD